MEVDATASGAMADPYIHNEIHTNDAITCLAHIWRQVPLSSVPKRVHVCVSGTTELVHRDVHRDVNVHIPQCDLAELVYDVDPKKAFFY